MSVPFRFAVVLAVVAAACAGEAPRRPNVLPSETSHDAGSARDEDEDEDAVPVTSSDGPRLEAFDDGLFQRATWSPDGRLLALSQPRSLVVVAGDVVRLRIPADPSLPVRFDGSTLSIVGDSVLRYDLETGARLDDGTPPPRTPRPAHDGDVVSELALDGGGWLDVSRTTTSTKTVVMKKASFHDDTGAHPYMAPFDVVRMTTRYAATRIAKDGTKLARELVALVCTIETQQSETLPRAHGAPPPRNPCNQLRSVHASPDGALVALVHRQDRVERVTVVALETGRREDLAMPGLERAHMTALAFAPGSQRMFVQSDDGQRAESREIDVSRAPARPLWSVTSIPSAGSASFSPDGSKLAIVAGPSVAVANASNGVIASTLRAHPVATLTAIAARPGAFVLGTDSGAVHVVSPEGIARVQAFTSDRIGGLAWAPSGASFVAHARSWGQAPQDKAIRSFDVSGRPGVVMASQEEATDMAFSPDGTRLFAATNGSDLLGWSTADGAGPTRLSTSYRGARTSVAVSATRYALAEGSEVALLSREGQSPATTVKVQVPGERVERVRFSSAGGTLYALSDTSITALDGTSGTQLWTRVLGEQARDPTRLDVGTDALLVTGDAMRTHLRSSADGSLLLQIVGTDTTPHAAFLGARLVVQEPHVVRVLGRKGTVLATLRFSSDGAGALVESRGRAEVAGTLATWCASGTRMVADEACDAVRARGLLGKAIR